MVFLVNELYLNLTSGFLLYIICKYPFVTYQTQRVNMLKYLLNNLLWYLLIIIRFYLHAEISIRVISADPDEQIKLTRRLEVGAGMCLELKE